MARARPHVVIARLNDEELRIYNWLLRSVAGVTYSKNKSKAFRTFLRRMAEYVKKTGTRKYQTEGFKVSAGVA